MRSQDGKIELQKKVHKRICISDITYLAAHCSSYVICHFCRFFHLLPPFCLLGKKMLCSKKFLAPENGVYGLQHSVSTALQKPEFMLVQVKNNNKKLKKRFIAIFFKFVHAYFSYWVMEILSITNDVLKKIFSK